MLKMQQAEACKSVEMAMKKCPNGMLAEVKYDGERVQVHKKGNEFRYFSRSLKPVLPHKVNKSLSFRLLFLQRVAFTRALLYRSR